ncbi:E3 ubiquitin-protein ligase LRSAM1-like [Patiria miniata]|uniref:E3 ubiquitin-protein ligase LRSAM1 n=1 Tax=Patiria miniata TaxID=46514 RepID=A0A913Z227_PATMI|nr:E3 ubiquitin-protein ligase LRSAM1-like [Patiria miniata]XP_038045753.1 E3 ubiquitin-protein ligase LRSAM1-like [Patiria miniata]XP_038045754.1 E3 ubiquitin-protein ligase LRSAM1-like [Patiria miniata]
MNPVNGIHEIDMPKSKLLHRQSESARKRMEHCQYLATESPEPTYDLSRCELYEVPSGTFSMCKVLRKEALILSDNLLSSLSGGGNIKDLAMLRVLDLHSNKLSEIPDALTGISGLQVLNLDNNQLKKLPRDTGKLQALQTLTIKGNQVKELPGTICLMKSLRTLDISDNKIKDLPSKLCYIRTLETLSLDAKNMRHPIASICMQGTEAIMKSLCAECGTDYSPPSQHVLNVLDPPKVSPSEDKPSSLRSLEEEEANLSNSIMQYEKIQESKRLERMRLERELEEMEREQAQLVTQTDKRHLGLLKALEKEQADLDSGIKTLQERSDIEKQNLLSVLHDVERQSTDLVHQLLEMNEKARKKEALLDQLEKERMELDATFLVVSEEHDLLREKDILKFMQVIMKENFELDQLRNRYDKHKENIRKEAEDSENVAFNQLSSQLHAKQLNNDAIVANLMKAEEFQREAFEMLLLSKDAKHKRLTEEIYMLQQQLAEVTMAELEKQSVKAESTNIALEQKREDLAALLKQLMIEREDREEELKKRLLEMEQRREDDVQDYWLIQFQRLMDRKPQSLIDQENNLEFSVLEILNRSGADDYIPMFARHRVTIETMLQLTDNDLKEIGVHEVGLRRSILSNIANFTKERDNASLKAKEMESHVDVPRRDPTAPSIDEAGASAVAGAALVKEVTVRVNAECVICMENNSDVLFLNCGHVCCCGTCSGSLRLCPLCRSDIHTKINMQKSSQSVIGGCVD